MRIWLGAGLGLVIAGAMHATRCGAAARQDLLRKTEVLVAPRVSMEPVVGEMPT